jgi:hypothetical protein
MTDELGTERLGLGWEVWFLVAVLMVAALALVVVPVLIAVGFDEARHEITHLSRSVEVVPARVVFGAVGAMALAVLTGHIVRTTDWNLD